MAREWSQHLNSGELDGKIFTYAIRISPGNVEVDGVIIPSSRMVVGTRVDIKGEYRYVSQYDDEDSSVQRIEGVVAVGIPVLNEDDMVEEDDAYEKHDLIKPGPMREVYDQDMERWVQKEDPPQQEKLARTYALWKRGVGENERKNARKAGYKVLEKMDPPRLDLFEKIFHHPAPFGFNGGSTAELAKGRDSRENETSIERDRPWALLLDDGDGEWVPIRTSETYCDAVRKFASEHALTDELTIPEKNDNATLKEQPTF